MVDIIIRKKKTITFYREGLSLGVAYMSINKKDRSPDHPSLDFSSANGEVEIVKFKVKKDKKED